MHYNVQKQQIKLMTLQLCSL